jgi:phosphatidylinositol glycan class B
VLDLFTWGAPFHSFLAYVRFNLIEGKSAAFGVEPLAYYFEVFWSAVGVSIVAVIIGLVACVGRATGLVVVVLLYVLAHTLVPHKEFRFMMPIVPLLLALSGVGLAAFVDRVLAVTAVRGATSRGTGHRPGKGRRDVSPTHRPEEPRVRKPIWVLACVLAVAMGWKTTHASFDDFGQRHGLLSGTRPLWHTVEPVNRLLWVAGEQPDLCGLALLGYGPIWTGGYTYLHRDVPILWGTSIDGELANYVLARTAIALPQEYVTIKTIGEAKLARRSGPCTSPPESYTRLFPKA